ncbi:DUF3833 domain-containing protein [Neptuniibacter halophilus]|uniref:DUF3833 domain-containing protein n=1 Tax=Neptuniibacter halophilus TaxID=651666 RepID=UPI0025736566|nr:DUF3833 domain-containing protein [Neptuniibacter halophilus]
MNLSKVALCSVSLMLSGCAASLEDYRQVEPRLELNQFFEGYLEAYGIVQDYRGAVVRRFRADMIGQWQGQQGVLDEQFWFADGETQHRCWRLNKQGQRYTGTAGDVLGQAEGRVAGNALNWQYQLLLPVSGREWTVSLNDWMYLIDEDNLINRAVMTKFGIEVGQITLYIRKLNQPPVRAMTSGCKLTGVNHEQ